MQAALLDALHDIASSNEPERTKHVWDELYDCIAAYAGYPVFDEFNDATKAATTADRDVQRLLDAVTDNLCPGQEESYDKFHSLSDAIELQYYRTDADFNEAILAVHEEHLILEAKELIKQYYDDRPAWIVGSRANSTNDPGSDLDIVVETPCKSMKADGCGRRIESEVGVTIDIIEDEDGPIRSDDRSPIQIQ